MAGYPGIASAVGLTLNESRGPDFIGLGAQKCGTSWIAACLDEHPQIQMPCKEIHFFSRDARWEQGREWYERLFAARVADPSGNSGSCSGEFSTSYLADPNAPERIAALYPDVRLICCLRSPVDRAVANYRNDVMSGAVAPDVPFAQALKSHPEYLTQGRYAEQLDLWLRRFARGRMLILILEDAAADPRRFISGIYTFLGVGERFAPPSLHRRVNVSRVPAWIGLDRLTHGFAGRLRQAGLTDIISLLKRTRVNDLIYAINSRTVDLTPLLPDAAGRRILWEEHFAADVRALEMLLGRDLSIWRPA